MTERREPDPVPADGVEGGGFPVPPRPRPLQWASLILGIVAVGAGLLGNEGVLLISCGLSVLANAASLLLEGRKTSGVARRR